MILLAAFFFIVSAALGLLAWESRKKGEIARAEPNMGPEARIQDLKKRLEIETVKAMKAIDALKDFQKQAETLERRNEYLEGSDIKRRNEYLEGESARLHRTLYESTERALMDMVSEIMPKIAIIKQSYLASPDAQERVRESVRMTKEEWLHALGAKQYKKLFARAESRFGADVFPSEEVVKVADQVMALYAQNTATKGKYSRTMGSLSEVVARIEAEVFAEKKKARLRIEK